MKKRKYVILMLLFSAFMMLYGCGDSSADNDYAPGNPQYDYDAWKAGQVVKGLN